MKKILLALIVATSISLAFAAPVAASQTAATQTVPKFDNTQMRCGEKTLKNGDSTDSLTDICKGFKFGKGKAGFLDDNSGKKVMCQEKKGKLILSTCQAAS